MRNSLACALILLGLTSCVVPTMDPATVVPSPALSTSSSANVPTPSEQPSTVTPGPTGTVAAVPVSTSSPTLTIVPTAPPQTTWLVDARQITDWPGPVYALTWETPNLLGGQIVFQQAWHRIEVDLTFPELSVHIAADQPNQSSRGLFTIERVDQQLVLSRTEDGGEVAREASFVEDCERLEACLFWSPDLTAVAYLAPNGAVWIWETNGSPARHVGDTLAVAEWLFWSPDSTMVTVLDRFAEVRDYLTYNVVFRDGRPMIRTGAQITNRTEGPPIWESNDLVVVYGDCGAGCASLDYYEALSGKPLAAATSVQNFEGAWLSPDHRWLMSESATSPTYLMNDLHTGGQVIMADGSQSSLDFVGWSDDSEGFFAVKRDLTGDDSGDLVSAFVRYWPATDKWSLIADHVVQAIPNDRRTRFLIVTYGPTGDGNYPLSVELIDSSGASLSDRYSLDIGATTSLYEAVLTLAQWDHQGESIMFATPNLDIATMTAGEKLAIIGHSLQPIDPYEASVLWGPSDDQALFVVSRSEAWLVQP